MKLEGLILQEAVKATFEQRQTQLADLFLTTFSDKFKRDANKEMQWKAFLNKNRLESHLSFYDLMGEIESFLLPVSEVCAQERRLEKQWSASDWQWK